MKKMFGVFCFSLMLFILPLNAFAQQPQCNDREAVLKLLGKKYEETTTFYGITSGGKLLEILASAGGKSWTIIVTDPKSKISCLVASGEGWRAILSKIPGTDISFTK